MKKDIILSGVGGQGILSIATVIGKAALKEGLYMKQAEVHGMSQRGGDVQSNLRISDKPIASDLIPSGKCDLIISLEPMEGLRYLPYLSPEGWLVTNETPFVNIPNYPEEDKVMAEINKLPHKIVLNVDKVADTASDDSQFFVRAVYVFVVRRFLGSFDEFVLAGKQYFIAFAGISRQQDKLTGIFTE